MALVGARRVRNTQTGALLTWTPSPTPPPSCASGQMLTTKVRVADTDPVAGNHAYGVVFTYKLVNATTAPGDANCSARIQMSDITGPIDHRIQ
jgi:hypothetical protein